MRKLFLFIGFQFLGIVFCLAQDKEIIINLVKIQFNYSNILPHYEGFNYFIDKQPYGFEINLGIQSFGKKMWEELYDYPQMGIGFFYVNLGNKDILGTAKSIFWFYNKVFIDKRRLAVILNSDFGIGYISKPFNPRTNHLNFSVSTKLNIHFALSSELYFKINNRLNYFVAFGFNHFSNGAIKKPNLGINLLNIQSGVNYSFGKKYSQIKTENKIYNKYNQLYVNFNLGATSNTQFSDKKKYIVSLFRVGMDRNVSFKNSFGVGIDIFYNSSLKLDYKNQKITVPNNSVINYIYPGLYVAYTRKHGKIQIIANIGVNYKSKLNKKFCYYQKLGVRYEIIKNIYWESSLKSNLTVARWVEHGICYKIRFSNLK